MCGTRRSIRLSLAIVSVLGFGDSFVFNEGAMAEKVPLAIATQTMTPQDVGQRFNDICNVPRASDHEDKIRTFLEQFGSGLGLQTITDNVGNVLIRKPPAAGMEKRTGVILQARMDMVALVATGTTHDFDNDPIAA